MSRHTPTPTPALARVSFSIDEAAAVMGLSSRHVYRLVWSGELRALRSGRRVLIPAAAIDEYIGALARVTTPA